MKEELYNWREDVRPRVVGKYDEKGEWDLPIGRWLLPPTGELGPARIARVIAARIGRFYTSPRIRDRLAFLDAQGGRPQGFAGGRGDRNARLFVAR